MKRFCAISFFFWILCASAFSEERGIIRCDPGSEYVPAWAAPGRPHVVERLKCDQLVSIIEVGAFVSPSQYSSRPSEYAKIHLGDNEAYVDAKYVSRTGIQELPQVSKAAEAPVEKQIARDEEETRKWNSITREDVKLRDEALQDPVYLSGPSTFGATLSNNSEFPISQLHLLLRIYDCPSRPKSDYSNCEIIGEAKPFLEASIPSRQTRRVMGPVTFYSTPRVRGSFAWSYQVLGIRTE